MGVRLVAGQHEVLEPKVTDVGHFAGERQLRQGSRAAGELLVGFVGSPVAAGKLLKVDASAALAVSGVVAVYTASDVPGHNMFGLVVADEPFLAAEDLLYLGQPVAVVAAETPAATAMSEGVVAEARGGAFVGCQFHPERSGPAGLRYLERCLSLA